MLLRRSDGAGYRGRRERCASRAVTRRTANHSRTAESASTSSISTGFLTLAFAGPPHRLVGIWANRTRPDFSAEELLLAELLRPHLQAGEQAARRAVARAGLTSREREVIDLVTAGATNAAVAEALVVSPGTVKKHLDNIYTKLGVSSRAAAAERAGRDHVENPRADLRLSRG
jgi:DNA-binding CsgD family transcriptional regulator